MKLDIILCGVGGQGILSIAAILGEAALERGLYMKQSEVHGMSQRGGDVQSHLRISDQPIYSDLIPESQADMIISLEPMEALRYLPYLSQNGWIVTSSTPFINIPNYPPIEDIHQRIAQIAHHHIVEIERVARENQMVKAANIILLGAASGYIKGISYQELENGISTIFARKGEAVIAMNLKALALGRALTE